VGPEEAKESRGSLEVWCLERKKKIKKKKTK
jgi:hypothetical protein